jgi:O-antigen ligase
MNSQMGLEKKHWHTTAAMVMAGVLSMVVFASVALTNIATLGLLILAVFAWCSFAVSNETIEPQAKFFLGLVLALCVWDVLSNVLAGQALAPSLKALMHDMRTIGFVILLWAVFMHVRVAQTAFLVLVLTVLLFATVNLVLTLIGRVPQGSYFTDGFMGMSHMSHMYGQAIVGLIFVLAQIWLMRPRLMWRVALPIAVLVASLFWASERRTGWVLLAAGLCVWCLLNAKRFFVGKYKWWLLGGALVVLAVMLGSDVVHRRMALAVVEFNQYMTMTPQERSAAVFGAVSVRMQYAATAWETIGHNNIWRGVGSIGFESAYKAAATSMGVSPQSWATYNWGNPHNEYLYMLATKGLIGLLLYLAVFAQACRVAWGKTDEVQRVGLVMFVFLFMLSITTNSMLIDMEEGHFTMLILLVFLAPKSLGLLGEKSKDHSH